MSRRGAHRVEIQRRGLSHRACCICGWSGHSWNELRPAEADAWHHVFGDDRVVDVTEHRAPVDPGASDQIVDGLSAAALVDQARAFADRPSPYSKRAISELSSLAVADQSSLQAAIGRIDDLLRSHSRASASTADREWLQLITARRLLQDTLEHEAARRAAQPQR